MPPEAKSEYYYEATRTDVLPLVPDAGSYLEVGCASGHFGAQVKAAHPAAEVWGIEPDPEAAARARDRLDRVVEGVVPEALVGIERTFGCLICNDVLEHMEDPWTALAALVARVEPGGWVVASIPNVRNPQTIFRLVVGGRWDYERSGVLDRTHLRFFTRDTACELLESAGLEVVETVGSLPLGTNRFAFLHLERWPLVNRSTFRQYLFLARRPGEE